ncbi:MAG: hypothetical protein D6776_00360 [Planctomycetota bacterium]|nr:MAG: hypothetical protein D6776_00360 [Planctomycetota bacterium]
MDLFVPDPTDRDARYALEIDSLLVAVFRRAEGLRSEREIVQIRQGGSHIVLHRMGPFAKGCFALEEGESDSDELYGWWQRAREAEYLVSGRKTGCVFYVDGHGRERMRWRFRLGQIIEWEGEPPSHWGEPYEIERLVIAHEGLEPLPPRDPD